jgi:hypothetical protein
MARVIGERANATAIAVPTWSRSVAWAADSSGRNGSWSTSDAHTPA